jgi:hypothetical protein
VVPSEALTIVSRADGAPGLSRESSFNRTAATILMVAVACADADIGLDGDGTVRSAVMAAAMSSMDIIANALGREW